MFYKFQILFILHLQYFTQYIHCNTDFYDLLGVSKDASKPEIRKAFKKLALEKHPDKNKDDESVHEIFTKINKAYEVLKDEKLRKKYDLYGEEGLKDDHFGNQYQSWSFYNEQFGIYDEDPEIITLSNSDFDQSVSGSEDIWFINFYSPHCSHCHTIAPTWRALAQELNGVIRIGAVNCHDDWMLCNMQGIQSYPSLRLYPTGEYYYGDHDKEKMISYILSRIDVEVVDLTFDIFKYTLPSTKLSWIISFCESHKDCISDRTLVKLAAMLENLVHVAKADCERNKRVCQEFYKATSIIFYPVDQFTTTGGKEIVSSEVKEIMEEVLQMLPEPVEVNDDLFQQIRRNISEKKSDPWLLVFLSGHDQINLELRKLTALISEINIGSVDCKVASDLCKRFHVTRYPSMMLYKKNGYEYHHGRNTAHDIANFARESIISNVQVLNPDDFPKVAKNEENWFIDFFAPWCPPCMKLLPEWRKAGKQIGGTIAQFGTVDCTVHKTLCLQYNVRSYPTTIFYNGSTPYTFSGYHSAEEIITFAEDILNPPVTILTPETFESMVNQKSVGETWLVDFFAPWCGPCMELAPTYRKLAKRLSGDANLGQIDCQQYNYFCQVQGVNSYPTIRMYPHNYHGSSHYIRHQGWRDLESLYVWVFQYFPSIVEDLNEDRFHNEVLDEQDTWIIDFYAPWCGHCVSFAPHFSKVAKRLEGKIKCGKVNCDEQYGLCREIGIRAYPTLMFYAGALSKGMSQPINGVPLNTLDTDYLYTTSLHLLENHLLDKEREKRQNVMHDEF